MRVRVRLFAILREVNGHDSIVLELEDGARVSDALDALAAVPPLAGVLERLSVQMAVNREYAIPQTRLRAGDELALIPPVSGGAPQLHARVVDRPLLLDDLARAVADPSAGAIVVFQGVTRDAVRLDYEAYQEMAIERIEAILREAIRGHGLKQAAAEHRIGSVPLGEPTVIVAASAAHREQAFTGTREIIDRIKAQAPIWKREVHADGSIGWVHARSPDGRPSERRSTDGRQSERRSPDGPRSERQSPDGRRSERRSTDGRPSDGRSPESDAPPSSAQPQR